MSQLSNEHRTGCDSYTKQTHSKYYSYMTNLNFAVSSRKSTELHYRKLIIQNPSWSLCVKWCFFESLIKYMTERKNGGLSKREKRTDITQIHGRTCCSTSVFFGLPDKMTKSLEKYKWKLITRTTMIWCAKRTSTMAIKFTC